MAQAGGEYIKKLIKFWKDNGEPKKAKLLEKGVSRFKRKVNIRIVKSVVKLFGEDKLNLKGHEPHWTHAFDHYADTSGIPKIAASRRGTVLKNVWSEFLKDYEDTRPDDEDEDGGGEEEEGDLFRDKNLSFEADRDGKDILGQNEEANPNEEVLHRDVRGTLNEFRQKVDEIKQMAKREGKKLGPEQSKCVDQLSEMSSSLQLDGEYDDGWITVLLAQNGMGKSTTTNECARQTEITNDLYMRLKVDEQQGSMFQAFETYEADPGFFKKPEIAEKLKKEENLDDIYMKICGRLNDERLPEFILPQAEPFSSDVCTPRIMEITYGAYALAVEFYTEKEVRSMISDVSFEGYREDSKENIKSSMHLRHMTSLLRTLQQKTEEAYDDDFTFDDSETSDVTPEAQEDEEELEYPTYKQPGSVKIDESMMGYMGAKKLFVGNQNCCIVKDRVYIREKIHEVIRSKYCHLIKKMIIRIPCLVARNNKILEVPGTDDENPIHESQLLEALEMANNVIVLSSEKSLKGVSDRVKKLLDEHVLPRWIDGGSPFRFSVLSCPKDRAKQMSCDQLVQDVNTGKNASNWLKWCIGFNGNSKEYLAKKLRSMKPKRFCNMAAIKKFFKSRLNIASCQLMLSSALQKSNDFIREHPQIYSDGRKYAQGTRMLSMFWGHMEQGEESHIMRLEQQLRPYVHEVGGHLQINFKWHTPTVNKGKHAKKTAGAMLKLRIKNFRDIAEEIYSRDTEVHEVCSQMRKLFGPNKSPALVQVEQALTCQDPEGDLHKTLLRCVEVIIAHISKLKKSNRRLLLDPNTQGRQGTFSLEKKLLPYVKQALLGGKLKTIYEAEFKTAKSNFSRGIRNGFMRQVEMRFALSKTDAEKKDSAEFKQWLRNEFLKSDTVDKELERRWKNFNVVINQCETQKWILEWIGTTIKRWLSLGFADFNHNTKRPKKQLKLIVRSAFRSLDSKHGNNYNQHVFSFEHCLARILVKEFHKSWNKRWIKVRNQIFYKNGTLYRWLLRLCTTLADRKMTRRTKLETTLEKFITSFVGKLQATAIRFNIAGIKVHKATVEIENQLNGLRCGSISNSVKDLESSHSAIRPEPSIQNRYLKSIRRWFFCKEKGKVGEFDLYGNQLSDACGLVSMLESKITRTPHSDKDDRDRSLLRSLLVCQKPGFLGGDHKYQETVMNKLAEEMGFSVLIGGRDPNPWRVKPHEASQFLFGLAGIQERKECSKQDFIWLNARTIQAFCDLRMCHVCVTDLSGETLYMVTPSNREVDASKPVTAYIIIWCSTEGVFSPGIYMRVHYDITSGDARSNKGKQKARASTNRIGMATEVSTDRKKMLHRYLTEGFKGLWDWFVPKVSSSDYYEMLHFWLKTNETNVRSINTRPIETRPIKTSELKNPWITRRDLKIISQDGDAAKSIIEALKAANPGRYNQFFKFKSTGTDSQVLRKMIVACHRKSNADNELHAHKDDWAYKGGLEDWNLRMGNIVRQDAPLNFLDIKAAADELSVKVACVTRHGGVFTYTPETYNAEEPIVLNLAKFEYGQWFAVRMTGQQSLCATEYRVSCKKKRQGYRGRHNHNSSSQRRRHQGLPRG